MTTLHAHVDRESTDCDGRYTDCYIVMFNDAERAESERAGGVNDFSDIHFMNRVFATEAGPYAVDHATIEITRRGFEYHEDTEEGYREASVSWCTDPYCDPEFRTHRDHRAEAAGY